MTTKRRKQDEPVKAPISTELVLKVEGLNEVELFKRRVAVNNNGTIAQLDTGATLVVRPSGFRAYQYMLVGDPEMINDTKSQLEKGEAITIVEPEAAAAR